MSIKHDNTTKQFHLYNDELSYLLQIKESGHVCLAYYGKRLNPEKSYPQLSPIPFSGFSNNFDAPQCFEYPTPGGGDFRSPALTIVFQDGSTVTEPLYKSHSIYRGKTKGDAGNCETLELNLADEQRHLELTLKYTIYDTLPIIARSAVICNTGNADINTNAFTLKNAMSACLELPPANAGNTWNMLNATGTWGQEFRINEAPLRPGFQGIASNRGISGAQQNPFAIFKRTHTTEDSGEAIGISLVYSGNFEITADVDPSMRVRVLAGLNHETFSKALHPGESFTTPEALIAYSSRGLSALSLSFHRLLKSIAGSGNWGKKDRPILLNNWEGTYFNFTEAKLLEMAAEAKALGVELFVLDDGWFGKRDSDNSSLGDWFPDKNKLPNGISGLAKKINALGLQFGLWIEPEMISVNSRLFEEHPDWAFQVQGREHIESRQQLVLDYSKPEVVDYIYDMLVKVISDTNTTHDTNTTQAPLVSYIKWDMNRCLTEVAGGETFHKYVLGVYNLYQRLTKTFPTILFEGCSSGGSRFDIGILQYAPQSWLSDDTDALERILLQEGASYIYPQSSWGAHVSITPNHQTGRSTPIMFRAIVAFFGAFGYELDPAKLSPEEKEAVKEQIAFYKKYRSLFQRGDFYRLKTVQNAELPFPSLVASNDWAAWQVVKNTECAKAPAESAVAYFRLLYHPARLLRRLKLKGLDPNATYQVSLWEEAGYNPEDKQLNCRTWTGEELMQAGLFLDAGQRPGDFMAELFLVNRI